jgi:hypothetical protein
MLMILLNAASNVSVILFASPQRKNRLVIKIKGRMGVSIFEIDLDIIFVFVHLEIITGKQADEFCSPNVLKKNIKQ